MFKMQTVKYTFCREL